MSKSPQPKRSNRIANKYKSNLNNNDDLFIGNKQISKEFNEFLDKKQESIEKGIVTLMSKSFVSKWLKKINLKEEITVKQFKMGKHFKKVANIELDNDIAQKGKKKGQKARKTIIKFSPVIKTKEWKEKDEWVYLFVMNDKIIKIGGSRVGLKERVGSYLCGHHTRERGGSGKMSVTNAFIYNTFEFYLKQGYRLEMYGYKIPTAYTHIDLFGKTLKVPAQVFHIYEAEVLSVYKKQVGHNPILSDNSDPNFRN